MRRATDTRVVLFAMLLAAACNVQTRQGGTGGGDTRPTGDPTEAGATAARFEAFLASDRSRLIRGDANEGRTKLTVTSTIPARFDWQSLASSLATLTDIDVATNGLSSTAVLTLSGDPGASGRNLTVEVVVTAVDENGNDVPGLSPITQRRVVRLTRPVGGLAISVTSDAPRVAPGASVNLVARISGGSSFLVAEGTNSCSGTSSSVPNDTRPTYNVVWRVDESAVSGASGDANLRVFCLNTSIPASVDVDPSETVSVASYTAPIGLGTVLVTAEASDRTGIRVTQTFALAVRPARELSVTDAKAASATVAPGESVALSAKASGGQAPFSINFKTSGAIPNATLTQVSTAGFTTRQATGGCTGLGEGDMCTVSYQAPADDEGTDVVMVTITDGVGDTATDTIPLIIEAEDTIKVLAQVDPSRVDPAGTADVDATITGGTPPYTVTFANNGSGTLSGSGLSQITSCAGTGTELGKTGVGSGATVTANYQAPATLGSEQITITACDNTGNVTRTTEPVFIASETGLLVTAEVDPLTVTLRFTGDSQAAGKITVNVDGGTPPYSVVSAAHNEPAADQAFDLGAPQAGGPPFIIPFQAKANVIGQDVVKIVVGDVVQQATVFATLTSTQTALALAAAAQDSAIAPGGSTALEAEASRGTPDDPGTPADQTDDKYEYTFTLRDTADGCLFENSCGVCDASAKSVTVTQAKVDTGASDVVFCADPLETGPAPIDVVAKDFLVPKSEQTATIFVTVGTTTVLTNVDISVKTGTIDLGLNPDSGSPARIARGQTLDLLALPNGGVGSYTTQCTSTTGAPALVFVPPTGILETATTIPDPASTNYTIACTVTDQAGTGVSVSRSIEVETTDPLAAAPTFSDSFTTDPTCVVSPNGVTLNITALDLAANATGGVIRLPDVDYTYLWQAIPPIGTIDDNSAPTTFWTIPATVGQQPVRFEVLVTDSNAVTVVASRPSFTLTEPVSPTLTPAAPTQSPGTTFNVSVGLTPGFGIGPFAFKLVDVGSIEAASIVFGPPTLPDGFAVVDEPFENIEITLLGGLPSGPADFELQVKDQGCNDDAIATMTYTVTIP